MLIFLQITKPIKGHLNSFNFIFLHNIQLPTSFFYFLQGFFGETAREKKAKKGQNWVNYDDITSVDQCFVDENTTNCVCS